MSNYEKYYQIIVNRIENPLPDNVYGENHHILPVSIYPEFKNDKSNLIRLSLKEHLLVHLYIWLYYKYETNQDKESEMMCYAIRNMYGRFFKNIKNSDIDKQELEYILNTLELQKKEFSQRISKLIIEKNKDSNYRKNTSEKLKKYLRDNPKELKRRIELLQKYNSDEKHKKLMSEFMKKYNNDTENLKKNIQRNVERYKDPNEHIKTSEAVKEYYRKHPEERIRVSNNSKKPILQYDKNGNFLKEWDCALNAGKYYKHSSTSIFDCISGRRRHAWGFIWRRKTDNYPLKIQVNI